MVLPSGVRLHWREAGDPQRPAVVWIHGGSVEDSSFMVGDLEAFFGRIRGLFPDTRGHGLSQKFERAEDLTYPKKAGDLLLWLDGLGVVAPVWGGASMGAALSLWVAAHRPERVRAVISISGPPFAPIEADQRWWKAHRALVVAGRFQEYFDANVRLRLGEAELARLKARPERYAAAVRPLEQHTVTSLLAVLDETYAGRLSGPLSHGRDVTAGRGHDPGSPITRGGRRLALSQPIPPRRSPVGHRGILCGDRVRLTH
ncbi:MAG: hypothetical protein AUH18_07380 [Candidatus Rokubacteria bacterium 13_2_20CM_69_10]|nr:MAG: hypothetical protein AUH18_07380 [Candidatus Rokubacteria bacterium 13_2_20CM_69_10]